MNKKYLLLLIPAIIVIIIAVIYFNTDRIKQYAFKPTDTSLPELSTANEPSEQVVAENLNIPWEIVFLPDRSMLVTERGGTLKHVTDNKTIPVNGVTARGEGGLLGMTLHPDFAKNNFIYLYSTTQISGNLTNRVERYTYKNNQLSNRTIILENIPGGPTHDGGRLAFGPDNMLYITTGDAGDPKNSQDKNSLAGKILRVRDNGSIPDDNPFKNAVYSYGHRNVQGITWDDQKNLWATEHGRSGVSSGFDELNLIKKGANYGWPTIEGDKTQTGMETPVINSGNKDTWAPSGITYFKNHVIFTGLRGEALYVSKVTNGKADPLAIYLRKKYGRLRSVTVGPDGYLYITTNNTDGRGTKKPGDDKIVRIKLDL